MVKEKNEALTKAELLKGVGHQLALIKILSNKFQESNLDKGNIETFGLNNLYSMHDDYIKNIIEKVTAYNNTAQQALVEAFQSAAYSPQQVFDFVWGKYLEISQYENQPLSKLTKDILEQLGIQR